MNGTGSFLAVATRSADPATATVRGTSKPAARSAVSWAALLTSISRTRPPFTTRRPGHSDAAGAQRRGRAPLPAFDLKTPPAVHHPPAVRLKPAEQGAGLI